MEQIEHETTISESNHSHGTSSMLEKVINQNGLIIINTERLLITRPLSLVIAARLSTGHPLGGLSIPLMNGILHIEGQLGQKEVQSLFENSVLDYCPDKLHYFSFATLNGNKETLDEPDLYLADPNSGISAKVEELGGDTVIIHNFATVSNYFLDDSEKDSIKAIKKLQAKNAAVIVFVENGTKGASLLMSMADIVFEVTKADNHFDAPINVVCIKYPPFEIEPPKPFCLSLSMEEDTWAVTEVTDPDETLDLIINLTRRNRTQEEIGDVVGLKQYQISRLLKKAREDGLIAGTGRQIRIMK